VEMIDQKWFLQNKGKLIGTAFGLLLGFVFICVGFWKMLFFALLIGLGFAVGQQVDRPVDMKELLDSILLDKWMRK
jgi:uncharacterized membrane protein